MSWLTKVLGIDARRNAEATAKKQAADTAAAEAAAEAQRMETARKQAEYQQTLQNIQQNNQSLTNSNQTLGTDTANNVLAGGSADAAAPRKKRTPMGSGAGVAAVLGINV